MVARSARAAGHFAKAFSGRTARKVYWALVVGVPEVREGTIDAALAKQPGSGGEKMHVDHENGQPAKTRYRVVDRVSDKAAWLELEPLTGRTHQLRLHLASLGHPILGDALYADPTTCARAPRLLLHACTLGLHHPVSGQWLQWQLPAPFALPMQA